MIQPADLTPGQTAELDAQGRLVRLVRHDEFTFTLLRFFDGRDNIVATLTELDGAKPSQWRVTRLSWVAGPIFDDWDAALSEAMTIAAR